MSTVLVVLHGLIVLGFTFRLLLRDDLSPPARLAWFIVLLTVPYAGSALYFLFGEIDLGDKADKRQAQIFARLRARAARHFGDADAGRDLIEGCYRPAFDYAASINGFQPVAGNRAELMEDPQATNDRLCADIDAAQDYVHVLYYIWLEDGTGRQIAEALMRAARRGVVCRAMADGLGSRRLIRSQLWEHMRAAGVQLAVALPLDQPLKTLFTSRIDLRNHRKITVIDGQVTYCGSRNAADPEFRVKKKYGPWVDIMLRFEGPVVAQNDLLFLSDWEQATGEQILNLPVDPRIHDGGLPALVMGDGPTERRGATPQLFSTLIACAQSRVTLSTPYFVPDATVMEALCAAAHRGVSVQLIFPKVNDSWIVASASRSYYRRLLTAGCRIYEHRHGLLHAKTLCLDGKVAMIGSSNLDLRSFDLNYENNILLLDEDTTVAIEARQAEYLAGSDAVSLEAVCDWAVHHRIWHNVVATFGPVL